MIQPVNIVKINTIPQLKHSNVSNVNQTEYRQVQQLEGVPRSYISFGQNNIDDKERIAKDESRRRQKMANYLELKSRGWDIDANIAAENEIVAKRNSGENKFLGIKYVKASDKVAIREKHRKALATKQAEYDEMIANEQYYKNLFKTEDIKVYEKTKQLLAEKPNAINSKIAGYQKEKDIITEMLVNPILREATLETSEKIPAATLIYGPIRCGKTELAKAIAEETGCNVEIIKNNEDAESFVDTLLECVQNAKEYYLETVKANNEKRSESLNEAYAQKSTGEKAQYIIENIKSPRTVIIIDDVDRYFDINTNGNSEDIIENNKTILKGLLDHCSEKPDSSSSPDAAGVSFIFTSNYPSLVDSEISLRRGKCEKLPISLPMDEDILDIAKFYLEKENGQIQKNIDEGRDISLLEIDKIPFNNYGSFISPSDKTGALTGSGVEKAVKASIKSYIDNPDKTISRTLPKNLLSQEYRIPNRKILEFRAEMEKMGLLDKPIDDEEEFELLKDAEKFKMLTPKLEERLMTLKDVLGSNHQ